jgi:hypothetical protein
VIEPVALDDIKTHLGLGAGAAADDAYLASLIVGARRMVERETHRVLVGDQVTISADDLETAKQAIRLIVGAWFANREAVTTTDARATPVQVPMAAAWIMDGLRAWYDGTD